jgi:hypothetical protein
MTTLPSPSNPELSEPDPRLVALCQKHRFTLVIDPEPSDRRDALGGDDLWPVLPAQLCAGRVIAAKAPSLDYVYNITHELAHGLVHGKAGFGDEKAVLLEQANLLAEWVTQLLKEKNHD